MKFVIGVLMVSLLSACSTIGGTVGGAGEDLSKLGNWMRSK